MKILTDEDVYIPGADVWDKIPINGSNWRLVRKNLVKRDFDNKEIVEDFFNTADKILFFSTPASPRYGLYLYIADVMKKKDIIFFHFMDGACDLPALSFLKGVNIMVNKDSHDTLVEILFSRDVHEYVGEILNKIMRGNTDLWLGGTGAAISQRELGKAIYRANKQLKFPRNILIFLFGHPSDELVIPLCERGIATVQRVPVNMGKIFALQEVQP